MVSSCTGSLKYEIDVLRTVSDQCRKRFFPSIWVSCITSCTGHTWLAAGIFPHNSSAEEVADPVRRFRPCRPSHTFHRQIYVCILKYAYSMYVHLLTYVNRLFSHKYIPSHIMFFLAQVLIPYKSTGAAVTVVWILSFFVVWIYCLIGPASWSSGQSLWLLITVPGSIPGSTVGIFPEGEDSCGDHGLGRLVEFRFKGPPYTPSSHITIT